MINAHQSQEYGMCTKLKMLIICLVVRERTTEALLGTTGAEH